MMKNSFTLSNVLQRELYPPMHHSISVEQVENRIVAVWYSASYETAPDSVIYSSTFENGKWNAPKAVVKLPGLGLGNPVLWKLPNRNEIWLLFVILPEKSWKSAVIARKISKDDGKSWSDIEIISEQRGLMTKSKPIKLSNGRYLIPIYDEKEWFPMVLISEKNGNKWNLYGDTTVKGVIQPNVVELDNGTLLMLSRTKMGRMYYSLSFNQGLSWISSSKMDVPNPNSGISLVKIKEKKIFLLAYNHSEFFRNRIDISVSRDGFSWSKPINVLMGNGEYSYPCILVDSENIHVFFTKNRVNFIDARANLNEILKHIRGEGNA